jgi:hypothetical protein
MHYLDFARARSAWIAIQQTTTLGMPIFDKMRELQPEEVRALIRAAGDIAMNVKILGMALTETDGSKPAPTETDSKPALSDMVDTGPARTDPAPTDPDRLPLRAAS